MARPIGYYVHHHGDGHRQRALAIARHMGGRLTLLGTNLHGRADGVPVINLPDDRLDDGAFSGEDGASRPAALHYAPLDHAGIRARTAAICGWIEEAAPALMIVDVSVEVAMLARLASVPTVYVRLGGVRLDPPHVQAFEGALAMLVPFHAALDDPKMPKEIAARSFYVPGIVSPSPSAMIAEDIVLVVLGRGGGAPDGDYWAAAARAVPGMRWRVIGPCILPSAMPPNLKMLGWIDDAGPLIASAGVVVGAAGDGVVNAVIAARRPFICLPEPRPFDEQLSKAMRLAACGAAIVCTTAPEAGAWPSLIEQALRSDPERLAALDDPNGAARAAAWITEMADTTAGQITWPA